MNDTADAAPDLQARREMLTCAPNPCPRTDYVVTLEGGLAWRKAPLALTIRYVPDRLVLEPAALAPYLMVVGARGWASLEEAAGTVLDDLNNELVPRWVQVRLAAPAEEGAGRTAHSVLMEDRQPHWGNPDLLARL